MCHPPASRSDITFDAFLRRVVRAVRAGRVVGVKLDFKHPDAVAPALALLRREGLGRVGSSSSSPRGGSRETSESTSPEAARVASMPVWLNADVIRGPGGREPVHPDGAAFVAACVDACPASTLSLGWTHAGTPRLGYTRDMAARMLALIEPVAQHVTLAASAAHLFASARGARRALLDVVELRRGATTTRRARGAEPHAVGSGDAGVDAMGRGGAVARADVRRRQGVHCARGARHRRARRAQARVRAVLVKAGGRREEKRERGRDGRDRRSRPKRREYRLERDVRFLLLFRFRSRPGRARGRSRGLRVWADSSRRARAGVSGEEHLARSKA